MERRVLQPADAAKPLAAYSHGFEVRAGRLIFVAGQVAVDASGTLVGQGDIRAQTRAVFENIRRVLAAAGAGFEHVVKFTTYLVDSRDIETYFSARAALFPTIFPDGAYPPNTLVIVDRLVREEFLIEVEAIAAAD
jgi:enamine deaminase RidA (YjgF/YER057c/UK114 family)